MCKDNIFQWNNKNKTKVFFFYEERDEELLKFIF